MRSRGAFQAHEPDTVTGPASQPPARFTGHNVALAQYPPTSMENWEYYAHDKKQANASLWPLHLQVAFLRCAHNKA